MIVDMVFIKSYKSKSMSELSSYDHCLRLKVLDFHVLFLRAQSMSSLSSKPHGNAGPGESDEDSWEVLTIAVSNVTGIL